MVLRAAVREPARRRHHRRVRDRQGGSLRLQRRFSGPGNYGFRGTDRRWVFQGRQGLRRCLRKEPVDVYGDLAGEKRRVRQRRCVADRDGTGRCHLQIGNAERTLSRRPGYALDWLTADLRRLPPPLNFLAATLLLEGSAGRSSSLRRAAAVVNLPIDALSATASAASPLTSAFH